MSFFGEDKWNRIESNFPVSLKTRWLFLLGDKSGERSKERLTWSEKELKNSSLRNDWIATWNSIIQFIDAEPLIKPSERDGIPFASVVGIFTAWFYSSSQSIPCLGYLPTKTKWSIIEGFARELETSLIRVLCPTLLRDYRDSRLGYSDYCHNWVGEFRANFFSKYSALPRIIGTLAIQAISYLNEFAEHYIQDWISAGNPFRGFNNSDTVVPYAEEVIQIDLGLSDRHSNGKTAIRIIFGNGEQYVYKPKCLRVDQFFWKTAEQFLPEWSLPLEIPKILDRCNYGWQQYVGHKVCKTQEQLELYYRRLGAYLALLHFLGVTDCHFENLIAAGDFPFICDLETMMHPVAPGFLHNQPLWDVTRTALLPRWEMSIDRSHAFDQSGIGYNSSVGSRSLWVWVHLGTDQIDCIRKQVAMPEGRNRPCFDSKLISAEKFAPLVVAGFDEAANSILLRKSEFRDAFLKMISTSGVRVIIRSTELYKVLLDKSFHSRFLTSEATWSVEFEVLARACFADGAKLDPKTFMAELASLYVLDIPKFFIYPYAINDGTIEGGMESAVRQTIERWSDWIMHFDHKEIAWQKSLVMFTLTGSCSSEAAIASEVETHQGFSMVDSKLDTTVYQIVKRLESSLTIDRVGRVTVLNQAFDRESGCFSAGRVDSGLYGGLQGILVFLAACIAAGDTKTKTCAVGLMGRLGDVANEARVLETERPHIGLDRGIAGRIYGELVIYKLIGGEDRICAAMALFKEAKQIFHLDPKNLEHVDVLSGVSGLLISYVCLWELTKDEEVKMEIAVLVKVLIQAAVFRDKHTGCYWNSDEGVPTCGYAHGTIGVCAALSRAESIHPGIDLKSSIHGGIEFEDSYFSEKFMSWPDIRDIRAIKYSHKWCHGSAGAILARIQLSKFYADRISEEMLVGCATMLSQMENQLVSDTLCCGLSGVIEALSSSEALFPDIGKMRNTQKLLMEIVERKRRMGYFRINSLVPGEFRCVSLFSGESGIGYTLLRHANRGLPQVSDFAL